MTIWRPAPRHQRSCPRPGDFPRPGRSFALCSIRSLTRPPPGPHPSQPHGPRARVCSPALARCPFVRITHRASRTGPRGLGQPARPAHAPPSGGASYLSESRIAHPAPGRATSASLPGRPMPPLGQGVLFVRITHRASRAGPRDLGQPARPAHAPLGRHRPICPNRAIRASQNADRGGGLRAAAPIPKSQTNPSGRNAAPPRTGQRPCGSALTPAARRRRAGRG